MITVYFTFAALIVSIIIVAVREVANCRLKNEMENMIEKEYKSPGLKAIENIAELMAEDLRIEDDRQK